MSKNFLKAEAKAEAVFSEAFWNALSPRDPISDAKGKGLWADLFTPRESNTSTAEVQESATVQSEVLATPRIQPKTKAWMGAWGAASPAALMAGVVLIL
jgi:hypothetical protein